MKIRRRPPDPFFYQGSETGILLIHGFTGTPSELRPMGRYLEKQGYTVYAPLLPGHGTSPEEMECTSWKDWWACVFNAYDRLRLQGKVRQIVAVGLSMGGALALKLAQEREVAGVVPFVLLFIYKIKGIGLSIWFAGLSLTWSERERSRPILKCI